MVNFCAVVENQIELLSCKSSKVNKMSNTRTFQIEIYKIRLMCGSIAGGVVECTKMNDRNVIKQTSEDAFECFVVVNTLTD